jgi:hypothetical protein
MANATIAQASKVLLDPSPKNHMGRIARTAPKYQNNATIT